MNLLEIKNKYGMSRKIKGERNKRLGLGELSCDSAHNLCLFQV